MVHRLNNARLFAAVGGKALIIPAEGWRAGTFRLHGRAMIITLHRLARITERQQGAEVVRAVTAAFKRQLEEVIRRFNSRRLGFFSRTQKATVEIFAGAHEGLLLDVLNQVLGETLGETMAAVVPGVQSTIAQGYSKTSILLGQQPMPELNAVFARQSQVLATRIVGISETTRTRFQSILKGAVQQGSSVVDVVREIRTKLPQIQARRAQTIARTELNNSWTKGSIQAMKENRTITEISVIGCESREEDRWADPSYQPYLYRGESTCLAQAVPIADADSLEFHVNHTGTIVPSGFAE